MIELLALGAALQDLTVFNSDTKKPCTKFWRCRVFDLQIAVLMLVQRILFNPCRPTDQQWNCFETTPKKNL